MLYRILRFTDRRRKFRVSTAQVPGVNGASSGCQRRRFRVSTVQVYGRAVQVQEQAVQVHGQTAQVHGQAAQVPKQWLNLHRESAFCVAPVAQVSALKWNRRHSRLNLRHRCVSGLFRNSPADVRTKNRQSSAVAMYVHPHLQPVEDTSSDVRTKKQHSSTVSMYVHQQPWRSSD